MLKAETSSNYQASDDDLCDFFFNPASQTTQSQAAMPAPGGVMEWELPGLQERTQKHTQKSNTASSMEADTRNDLGKKKFIKLNKKLQMETWLEVLALPQYFARLNEWERKFIVSNTIKFRRYGANKAKWVTEQQYQCLRAIATKHLKSTQEATK